MGTLITKLCAMTCFSLGRQHQWAVAVEAEGSEEILQAKKKKKR